MYFLEDPDRGWVSKPDIPMTSNHIAAVTATDEDGNERHYFFGGQSRGNECCGNIAKVYEFDAMAETWIERAPMLFTRGHASSSAVAIGCGFLIAGGTSNELGKLSDVSYYHIPTNTWSKVGDLVDKGNLPLCDLDTVGGYLVCIRHCCGKVDKRKISW